MRNKFIGFCLSISFLLVSLTAAAGISSERFAFKNSVTLRISTVAVDGLRLDTVRFKLPAAAGETASRTAGPGTVYLTISNTATGARRMGVAVALFDEQDRLVGVASGGSRLTNLKSGRQKQYRLVFEDVNGEIARATTFQVTVESKP